MTIAAGGRMLNFGYWDDSSSAKTPLEAQQMLCAAVGELAELASSMTVLDVGSGLGAPAAYWKSCYKSLQVACVNINFSQLQNSKDAQASLVNATSTALPFASNSVDRVIALESAQHFRPLGRFVQESARVLDSGGLLVMAIPVLKLRKKRLLHFLSLGILAVTWSSEHYDPEYVERAITGAGLSIESSRYIGKNVYGPLADYYLKNRENLRPRILAAYPAYLEKILYRSILKMKQLSDKGDIEYVLLKARKTDTLTREKP
ncbi:methyltransferase family protein [Candidatus Nitrososphaera evergladensis SR1]|uniref:Methyltransferase family protein n=1 Tax=Candidatus Nitrososphaera evergladensis SR1 TaxID=1459636 RepID=A0A075MNN1_9ARCH|nr:class I SAM-dependent methyltransferase [Candidatus Nitrososphaera evergladensis]AIF82818.1 methyltransferase family protein [Candidatus Nitrososphaera evergladensis SR1]